MVRPSGSLSAAMRFAKYQGLGNDFIIVDAAHALGPDDARALCDRFRGIGADGVLLVDIERPSMKVLNADGSAAEMCGNGLRCVVRHLHRRGVLTSKEVVVETAAGPHRCWLRGEDIEVEMRAGTLDPETVPLQADAPFVDAPFIEADGAMVHVTAVGMGNPHAVIFDDIPDALRRTLGPRIQSDPRFPSGVNVGFARKAPGGFELHVLERGSGWTQACGTGACAAAVAAVATGRAAQGQAIDMHLPGGTLTITVHPTMTRMCGPARHVFDGGISWT